MKQSSLFPTFQPARIELGAGLRVESPSALGDALVATIGPSEVEHFVAVVLDRQLKVLEAAVLGTGSDRYCVVDPRVVLRYALTRSRLPYGIIVAHNHPTGVAAPSAEDLDVTARLAQACRVVGVELLDHLVVGDRVWYSMRAQGEPALAGETGQWKRAA